MKYLFVPHGAKCYEEVKHKSGLDPTKYFVTEER